MSVQYCNTFLRDFNVVIARNQDIDIDNEQAKGVMQRLSELDSDINIRRGRKKPEISHEWVMNPAKKLKHWSGLSYFDLGGISYVLLVIGDVMGLLPKINRKVYEQFSMNIL